MPASPSGVYFWRLQNKMRIRNKAYISSVFALSALMIVSAVGTFAFAHSSKSATVTKLTTNATARTAQVQFMGTRDMTKIPAATAAQLKTPARALPEHKIARTSGHGSSAAPKTAPAPNISSGSPALPNVFNSFDGMADSGTTCPYFGSGCQPPDMAIAAGQKGFEVQEVNMSVAIYDVAGHLQSGWPKTSTSFFGVPSEACDPGVGGAFLSDPRAFYDSTDARFGVAMLQVEGVPNLNGNCPFQSYYWIAVSTSSVPTGSWNIYRINMICSGGSPCDPTAGADYTQIGFNADGIYMSGNMFGSNFSGNFDYAEVIGCNKALMYAGQATNCSEYLNLTVTGPGGTVAIDTVNPTNTLEHDWSTHAELFVSSFNSPDPFGDDCVSTACHGVSIWSMSAPGTSSVQFAGVFVDTNSYVEPQASDQPGCTQCVESLDNRVSATPVYHAGSLFAAHETNINNGSQTVPGAQWWEFRPTLSVGYPAHITGATVNQDAYLAGSGDISVSFPALTVDTEDDLIMVYDYMSSTINPGINYTGRRVTDPINTFPRGLGRVVKAGLAPTSDSRWGDYEAGSFDGFQNDNLWIAAQYSGANGDWSTFIVRLRYGLNLE